MTDVLAAAVAFRQAIIDCPDAGLISLADFPKGACGDASPLLGQFLKDQGHGEWHYVSGCRERDYHSHAWLERDGWILDITADQFSDVTEPVVLTQDKTWHSQFLYAPMKRQPAGIAMFDEHTNRSLAEAYKQITTVHGQ
ncbi:hypothetical protein [Streptomyces sp. NBC_01236]|uniref:hypothetical protein n=1 Tax=Streptomyces sp. NBC_01236 TaxID=2903789 RepID=UPI002E0F962D|nr:hypothetical protein OG324_08905 [Streptomyces sp. NBC_01236]